MGSSPVLNGLVGAAVALVLVKYLSGRAAHHGEGGELRYGLFLKVFGWVLAIGVAGLIYVTLFIDHRGQYVPLSLLILGFGAGAAGMICDAYRTRGFFDADGIEFQTPWSGRKVQQWSDLIGVEFNSSMKWYVFSFRDGSRIRMSNLILGHGRVLDHVRSLGHQVH